jgi:hypothetical protein
LGAISRLANVYLPDSLAYPQPPGRPRTGSLLTISAHCAARIARRPNPLRHQNSPCGLCQNLPPASSSNTCARLQQTLRGHDSHAAQRHRPSKREPGYFLHSLFPRDLLVVRAFDDRPRPRRPCVKMNGRRRAHQKSVVTSVDPSLRILHVVVSQNKAEVIVSGKLSALPTPSGTRLSEIPSRDSSRARDGPKIFPPPRVLGRFNAYCTAMKANYKVCVLNIRIEIEIAITAISFRICAGPYTAMETCSSRPTATRS